MPRLLPRRAGIYGRRRLRRQGSTPAPPEDPLVSCDWSCPGECRAFHQGLDCLLSIFPDSAGNGLSALVRDLERKWASTYWSRLKCAIIRCDLSTGERSFVQSVISWNPYLQWQTVGFIPYNQVSNPPVIDYILNRIKTEEEEEEVNDALDYVYLLHELKAHARHTPRYDVRYLLSLFCRRYAEAFGPPYQHELDGELRGV